MHTFYRPLRPLYLALLTLIYQPAHAELDNDIWIVRSGDGLYGIARNLAPKDLKMQARIRDEITRLNPRINTRSLEIGLTLKLPDFLFKAAEPAPVTEPVKLPQRPAPTLISQTTADPAETIGRVVIQSGEMVAENRGSTRTLKRTADILKGDTLKTAANARSQIRLKDGALLAIAPGTELKFEDYAYNGSEDGSERSIISLVKGGFRTITGAIGHVNKKNYQVKTSVATIGIRGTHYGLMLCTGGSCQNNPASGNLSDGLYGGVVDGSIVTTNESGTSTFNNDQYFHITSSISPAIETLMPPPVFNDAPPPENQPEPQAMADNPGPDGKAPVAAMPGTVNAGSGTPSFNRNPIIAATFSNVFLPPKDIQPGQTTPPPPTGATTTLPQPAASGSGIAISLSQYDLTVLSGVAAPIIVRDGGKNGIFLEQYTDSTGKVIKNLPFAIHEEHTEFDGTYQTHDAVRLRPNGSGASYVETQFGGNSLGVNWGAWQGNYILLESLDGAVPAAVTTQPYAHFIYSNNLTPMTTLTNLGGLRANIELYKVIGGTMPSDTFGNIGTELPYILASLDFSAQRLIDYQITVTTAGGTWTARNAETVNFDDLDNSFNLSGNGLCTSCTGEASLIFVGGQAGGAMTSYSVQNLTDGVNGVALLTPGGGKVATPGAAMIAMGDLANPTSFGVLVNPASRDSFYTTANNAVVAAFDRYLGTDSLPAYRSLLPTPNPSQAAIVSSINLVDGGASGIVYWGHWNGGDASVTNDGIAMQTAPAHFIHSNNVLAPTQLGGLSGTATYNSIAAEASINGVMVDQVAGGTVTVIANIDFGNAMLTNYVATVFDGASTTVSGALDTFLVDRSIPFSELSQNFALQTPANCTGCTATNSNASFQFVGVQDTTQSSHPTHAITSFAMQEGLNQAAGTALLMNAVYP